jgi:hypothetical protein
MGTLIIRHKVKDYGKWRPVFDRQAGAQLKNSYAVSSVCTTENGRYDISGHVTNVGSNRYQGTVMSGNESGRVIMVHRGDQQSVTVTSPSGSAKLALSRR